MTAPTSCLRVSLARALVPCSSEPSAGDTIDWADYQTRVKAAWDAE